MGPVGLPGHVRYQKSYREILNNGWREGKLYGNLKSMMQAK